jgi:prepilin-type N-terminal cleavage/methylation domain-containing protein
VSPAARRRRTPKIVSRVRRGSTLIEIMVAMTVMVVAVTGLAGMTVHAGRRAATLTATAGRTAVQTEVVEQLMVLPYNSLPSKVGCTTATSQPFPHRRCVSVTDLSFRQRRVAVVFTPSSPVLKADSVVFERAKGVSNSPLR